MQSFFTGLCAPGVSKGPRDLFWHSVFLLGKFFEDIFFRRAVFAYSLQLLLASAPTSKFVFQEIYLRQSLLIATCFFEEIYLMAVSLYWLVFFSLYFFSWKEKVNKKFKDAAIAPRARPGLGTTVTQSLSRRNVMLSSLAITEQSSLQVI